MRAYIAQTLANDEGLRQMGFAKEAVYSAENVDTPSERPFIVIRWLVRDPVIRQAPSQPNRFQVWCYDERGDYSRIDAMLDRVREVLTGIRAQQTSTGWITRVDWDGDGGDAYDDVYEALVRTSSYTAVASYAVGVP